MLRRGESSWSCLKFEFAFFAGHGILIRVLPPSFLALTVNELCLLFWPNPCVTSCFLQHIFLMIPNGIFMLLLLAVERFAYEISCLLEHSFLMRFPCVKVIGLLFL